MKENSKYHNYRFIGKINIDEIMPWFDFDKGKPWDEMEVPWVLENKVRREILIKLADGPKNFQELYKMISFSPNPLLITPEEYKCNIGFQWTEKTIQNHLMNLEWYNLIKLNNGRFELTIPILTLEDSTRIEEYIFKFTRNWLLIIKDLKEQIQSNFPEFKEKKSFYEILIEKSVEKLYELLKKEKILPDKPNLKILWAEQLRNIKFEDWVSKNF